MYASMNARIFKPLSIILVCFGHFYSMGDYKIAGMEYWWNISAICLVYFSICSAYFTNLKYSLKFSFSNFWINKMYRLGIKVIIVNLFLLFLFVYLKKNDILNVYTLINMLGFTGFLNWFGIKNSSPFGAGLWFLTLLYIYYCFYPLLSFIFKSFFVHIVFFACLFAFFVLDRFLNVGHTLWLTASGFFVGMYLSTISVRINSIVLIFLISLIFFIVANIFGFKFLNGVFIVSLASSFFMITEKYNFNTVFLANIKIIDSFVLEIFMLHTYLFIFPFSIFIFDFMSSIIFIIFISYILSNISIFVSHLSMSKRQYA